MLLVSLCLDNCVEQTVSENIFFLTCPPCKQLRIKASSCSHIAANYQQPCKSNVIPSHLFKSLSNSTSTVCLQGLCNQVQGLFISISTSLVICNGKKI